MILRLATLDDVPALTALIAASVRVLQANEYTPSQREKALEKVFGVDTQLISDGTYFVAEEDGQIAGCGGWSKRKTLFGADHCAGREDALLDPSHEAAKIRAFFIHPDWARRGIGTKILAACEDAARTEGFSRFEMGATLTGVALYKARGYREAEHLEVALGDGEVLPIVRMEKSS
jgi:N-acetylglutamate synthase-like GNAT family acetyltransferase